MPGDKACLLVEIMRGSALDASTEPPNYGGEGDAQYSEFLSISVLAATKYRQ